MENERAKKGVSRRFVLKAAVVGSFYGVTRVSLPVIAWANEAQVIHPMMNPKKYSDKSSCPNCGMNLNMWARTRHEFMNSEGDFSTCSIRCLADMSNNSGEVAQQVKVALYLQPEQMIEASQAFYLIGSKANGTMTMKSKIAFDSQAAAENFAAANGGKIVPYERALKLAAKELSVSRPKIEANRTKKGKIAEPGPEVRCSVCGMYPARYPAHRCQLTTKDDHYHFCSSQCLVSFHSNPKKYIQDSGKTQSIWVTVYPEGGTEYAEGLYYLVGSSIMGPMGKEALPFRSKAAAMKNSKENGGKVVRFKELTSALLMGE